MTDCFTEDELHIIKTYMLACEAFKSEFDTGKFDTLATPSKFNDAASAIRSAWPDLIIRYRTFRRARTAEMAS